MKIDRLPLFSVNVAHGVQQPLRTHEPHRKNQPARPPTSRAVWSPISIRCLLASLPSLSGRVGFDFLFKNCVTTVRIDCRTFVCLTHDVRCPESPIKVVGTLASTWWGTLKSPTTAQPTVRHLVQNIGCFAESLDECEIRTSYGMYLNSPHRPKNRSWLFEMQRESILLLYSNRWGIGWYDRRGDECDGGYD